MTGPESESSRAAEMVETQIVGRGINDRAVLQALRIVPRHLFVPGHLRCNAYEDHPLTIGEGQTISQPYIVALMTANLELEGGETVLEVGTGSGYQAAVLSRIVARVYTIEVKEILYRRARRVFESLAYDNITSRHGDGYYGWPEAAPFDAIMVTAATGSVPYPLLRQLRIGGRIILPLGTPPGHQRLTVVTRDADGFREKRLSGVMFVPMTGRASRP